MPTTSAFHHHNHLRLQQNILSPELHVVNRAVKATDELIVAETETSSWTDPPPRRTVTFNQEVYVREIEHINDMDDDEVDDIWYSRGDYKDMKAKYSITARMMARGWNIPEDDPEHCTRGLEYRTPEGSRARQLNKITSLTRVLDEQERQRITGIESDGALAEVYIRSSSHCREASLKLGLKDEKDVDYAEVYQLMFQHFLKLDVTDFKELSEHETVRNDPSLHRFLRKTPTAETTLATF